MPPNPYLLAADHPDDLITLLQTDPSIAASQDEHGYSLVHAATSYNHLDLLRTLVRDYKVPVDIRDEDGETALFVAENVEAAKVLVEELSLDTSLKNDEGQTAREKIEAEEEFPEVAEYLRNRETASASTNGTATNGTTPETLELPPVPEGLQVTLGTMDEAEAEGQQPDPEFRRRIEELAARPDFQTAEGQAELRRLVEEAITGEGLSEERSVRPRQD
ncbi:ankyrin repeat domain-containing protein 53 [Echria macrotheca]|uniref:Ankyrin repeat domain-containing protein 53 n=1 Tax=Echria macrotheca TaxID=438768 RepID=A0AAJ0FA04_9PEZI|nr:ankyrin repeat domain-containing protein 53 [Echria macrotheca]